MSAVPITLDIKCSPVVLANLRRMAAEAGLKQGPYAQLLFDAAYAAKAKAAVTDVDIDRMVALVALCAAQPDAEIAAALGCETAIVAKIRRAWLKTFDTRGRG
jgi:hypothetical protein